MDAASAYVEFYKLCINIPILKGTCEHRFFYLCFGNIEVMTISQCLITSQPPCTLFVVEQLKFNILDIMEFVSY